MKSKPRTAHNITRSGSKIKLIGKMFTQEDWEKAKKAEAESLNKKVGGILNLRFVGVDGWDRPIFKDARFDNMYFGDANNLFHPDDDPARISKLYRKYKELDKLITYFGDHFACEPRGRSLWGIKINII